MNVRAFAYLYPGSSGGKLWGGLYDCSGNYVIGTNVLSMSSTGSSGQVYETSYSSHGSLPCGFGAVEAWSYAVQQATTPVTYGTSLG